MSILEKQENEITQLCNYEFHIPEKLIAQAPLKKRDLSRLLIRHKDGSFIDSSFDKISQEIPPNSLIILNNSKVLKSRVFGKRETGGAVEILLLEVLDNQSTCTAKAVVKPLKKLKQGDSIILDDRVHCQISKEAISSNSLSPVQLEFNVSKSELNNWVSKHGFVPLPPYIKRLNKVTNEADTQRYQTIYAELSGSAAAPTAGLHFTDQTIEQLQEKGSTLANITLHIGLGTFAPIRSQDITKHSMHSESYMVPSTTLELIKKAQKDKQKIIYVGTTTLRTLESFYLKSLGLTDQQQSSLTDTWHETDIFLHPKKTGELYKPWACNALLTNFHQPKSTLSLLLASLVGQDHMKSMYNHAVTQGYRFHSYGDANLVWL